MKLLFKLLKIDLVNTLALAQYRNTRKNKAKSKSPLITSIVVILIMAIMFSIYGFGMASIAHTSGNDAAIIIIAVGFGGYMTLIMTFGKAHGTLFKSKDFELLSSLPIPTSTIVASKITSLLIVNYLYFTIGYLPSFFFYLMFSGFSILKLFVGIVALILGPLFATSICAVFSFLIGFFLSKSKHKNLLTTITSIIFVILIFLGTFTLEFAAMNGAASGNGEDYTRVVEILQMVMEKGYFLSAFIAKAMEGNLLYLLFYALISIVPIVIFVYVVGKVFVRINSLGNSGYKNKNFKLDKAVSKEKKGKILPTLIKKEFKTLFGIPGHAMQILTGPVMGIVMCVVFYFMFKELDVAKKDLLGAMVIILGSSFAMNMVPSSATAISMEGNKLWIMKVAPVATEKILLTKVITNILLCIPTIIINTVLGVVLWGCGIVDVIFLILVPLVAVAAMSALSLWINTHKYRLDWVNPTQLKQGTETLISMLLSYLLDILLIAPSIILTLVFGIYGPAIALVIVVVEACVTFAILFTNGKKRYDSIEI